MCRCLEKIEKQGYRFNGIYRQRIFAPATASFSDLWVADASGKEGKVPISLNFCPICGEKMGDPKLSGEKHDE